MTFLKFKYEYGQYKFLSYKFLKISLKSLSGRSNNGRITHRGRGKKLKNNYRLIDFYRYLNLMIPYIIKNFKYDPNRNIFLILVIYINGIMSYLLTPNLVKIGEIFFLHQFKSGELFPSFFCFSGMFIYNVQYRLYINSQLARASGSFVILLRKIGNIILLRLKSKEELFLWNNILVSLGRLSGELNKLYKKIKAGQNRYYGFKPMVRGVAKNPIDHPHGGGSGRTTSAQPSLTPWGYYTKGIRTSTRFKKKKKIFFKRRTGIVW